MCLYLSVGGGGGVGGGRLIWVEGERRLSVRGGTRMLYLLGLVSVHSHGTRDTTRCRSVVVRRALP